MLKINQNYINSVVKEALKEDLRPNGDITTELISFKNKKIKAKIIAKQNGIIAGLDFCKSAFNIIGKESVFISRVKDGSKIKKNQPKKVMLVTECSMSDNVQADNPNVEFIKPCNICPYMKKITLQKILDCLENESNEIFIEEKMAKAARQSVQRMAEIGR